LEGNHFARRSKKKGKREGGVACTGKKDGERQGAEGNFFSQKTNQKKQGETGEESSADGQPAKGSANTSGGGTGEGKKKKYIPFTEGELTTMPFLVKRGDGTSGGGKKGKNPTRECPLSVRGTGSEKKAVGGK